ncbi:MAG: hypothetical protein EOM50_12975 [Erysipelotrichia bacterium]|nr:hypothetical protein [Erysipelotrichia bacterium]
MIKIISSEEYAKLTGDIDYWKALAVKEEKRKNFYENLYKSEKARGIELIKENQSLDRKLEELEKDKVTFISFGEVKSLRKARGIAEEFRKTLNNEHNCNRNCFKEHILPAIQRDYDSIDSRNRVAKYNFVNYWYDNLLAFYPWLKRLYSINGIIRFE